jgi:hypothetical protein
MRKRKNKGIKRGEKDSNGGGGGKGFGLVFGKR